MAFHLPSPKRLKMSPLPPTEEENLPTIKEAYESAQYALAKAIQEKAAPVIIQEYQNVLFDIQHKRRENLYRYNDPNKPSRFDDGTPIPSLPIFSS